MCPADQISLTFMQT